MQPQENPIIETDDAVADSSGSDFRSREPVPAEDGEMAGESDAESLSARIVLLEAHVERQAELLALVSEPDVLGRRVELMREIEDLEKRLKQARKQKKAAVQEARQLREWYANADATVRELLADDMAGSGQIKAVLRELFPGE